jgi:hypothetical protein
MPINPVSIVALVIAAYWGVALLRTRNRPAEWRSPTIAPLPSFSRDTYTLIGLVGIVAALAVAVVAAIILAPN